MMDHGGETSDLGEMAFPVVIFDRAEVYEHLDDTMRLMPKLIGPGSFYGELSTLEVTAAAMANMAGHFSV